MTTSTFYILSFLLFFCISIEITVDALECLSIIDQSVEENDKVIVQAENYSDAFDIEENNLANIADPKSKGVDVGIDLKYANGLVVSYVRDTEWLEYNIATNSIPSEFIVTLSYSGAHKVISSTANIFINGEEVANALVFPTTTTYKVYGITSSIPLTLPPGDSSNGCFTIRILFVGGGVNFNYLEIQGTDGSSISNKEMATGDKDDDKDTSTEEKEDGDDQFDQGGDDEDQNDNDDDDVDNSTEEDDDDDDDDEYEDDNDDYDDVAEIKAVPNCDASFKAASSVVQAEEVFRAKDDEMENKYTGEVETIDGFDLKINEAFDNGQAVGYTKPGEWLEYDLAFPEPGNYVVQLYYGMGKPDVSTVQLYFDEVSVGEVDLLNTSSDLVVKSVTSAPITVSDQQLCTSFRIEWKLGKVDFDQFQFKIVVNDEILDYEEYVASKVVEVVIPPPPTTTTTTSTAATTTAATTTTKPTTLAATTISTTAAATTTSDTPTTAVTTTTTTIATTPSITTPSTAGGSIDDLDAGGDEDDAGILTYNSIQIILISLSLMSALIL